MSTIIVATFEDESKTYQAFSEIKRAATEGKLKINGLTIMHRRLDGQFEVRDAAQSAIAVLDLMNGISWWLRDDQDVDQLVADYTDFAVRGILHADS